MTVRSRGLAALPALAMLVSCSTGPTSSSASPSADLERLRAQAALAPCPPGVALDLPALSLPCLDGRGDIAVATAPQRPQLVNFYNALCAPCQKEFPLLTAYEQRPNAIAIVGVDAQDTEETALAFARDFQARWPVVLDTDGRLFRQYAGGWPVTIAVRPNGSLAGSPHVGAFKSVAEIEAFALQATAESAR